MQTAVRVADFAFWHLLEHGLLSRDVRGAYGSQHDECKSARHTIQIVTVDTDGVSKAEQEAG